MYLMLQQDKPDDFVIATGKTTEIREFVRMAFNEVGITMGFKGKGVDEEGFIDSLDEAVFKAKVGDKPSHLKAGQVLVKIDPRYFRPTEVELLIGDPTKANTVLGWKPEYDLAELVSEMVEKDVELFRKDKTLRESGFHVKQSWGM